MKKKLKRLGPPTVSKKGKRVKVSITISPENMKWLSSLKTGASRSWTINKAIDKMRSGR